MYSNIIQHYLHAFRLGLLLVFFTVVSPSSQQLSAQYSFKSADSYQQFLQARQWFAEEQYHLAFPVFQQLLSEQENKADHFMQLHKEELKFHLLACRLVQGQERAANEAELYLSLNTPEVLKGQLRYYLSHYYFGKNDFKKAIESFELASVGNLSNNQVAAMHFAQGYSYFTQKNFTSAKPLLQTVAQMEEHPQYIDANYYYGLIAFHEKKYRDALAAFEIAKQSNEYATLVPYYSSSIKYSLGDKEGGLKMAQQALKSGDQYYSNELKLLVGHAYFEQGKFAEALPYLEAYVANASAVKRQDLYELAYCYYQNGNYNEAIENFKPLSGGEDSLSHHAMYLLGDLYLKKSDKPNARNAFLFAGKNNANATFKEISLFNYGKLSYELGFDAEALPVLKNFVTQYPSSQWQPEASDLLVNVLSNTSNYKEALEIYSGLKNPSTQAKRNYPKILYNRAQQLLSDRQVAEADNLLQKVIASPYNDNYAPLAHFWLGELNYAKAKYPESIHHYKVYLQQPVENGEAKRANAHYNLGYGLLMTEQFAQAQQSFETASNLGLTSSLQPDLVARIADCQYMQKQFGPAAKRYQMLVDDGAPSADYALYQLGMIAGAQNNNAQKINTLASIAKRYPSSAFIQMANLEIANTYLVDENFRASLPYLDNILRSNASLLKPEALLKQGLAYYNLEQNNEAVKSLELLVKQYAQSDEAAVAVETLRTIYVEEGKTQEYITLMKQLGRNVDDAVADSLMYYAAELQLSDGKKDKALQSLEAYVKAYPNGNKAMKANFQLAEMYRADKKDFVNAMKHYEAVISKSPNAYAESSMLYASRIAYFEMKNYNLSAEKYKQLYNTASSDANRAEALRGLVRSYFYTGSYKAAEDYARELNGLPSAATDDKMFAAFVLGRAAIERNDCDAAIPQLKKVIAINKAEPAAESRYYIAKCYLQQNRLEDAEEAAFEVINKSGSYEDWVTKSYLLLGDIFMAQGDYFNAKATYKSVAENASMEALRNEAKEKLTKAEKADATQSRLGEN